MKTNLEKITSLLCEVEEVNKQIKELKFGCKILLKNNHDRNQPDYIEDIVTHKLHCSPYDGYYLSILHKPNNTRIKKEKFEIIGNPIEYHHLMMYCEEKDLPFCISGDYLFTFPDFKEFTLKSKLEIIAKIDYTKPLHQQSEETLGQIFNFLKG